MEEYRRIQERRARMSTATGVLLSVVCHVALALLGIFYGLEYIYPPPQEKSFVIDFAEVAAEDVPASAQSSWDDGADPGKLEESRDNGSEVNKLFDPGADSFGDVEIPRPQKEEVDSRSLFPGTTSEIDIDSLAARTSATVTEALKAGHSSDNARSERTGAWLEGRKVSGVLPKPKYTGQETGTVVVRVWVDQYGEVKKAQPGEDGTTVASQALWTAARNAALQTRFSISAQAPALQQGTITYIFSLK